MSPFARTSEGRDTDHAAHNLAILRHVALNLLRQDTTAKCGIKARRLKAGWSTDYLRPVLAL